MAEASGGGVGESSSSAAGRVAPSCVKLGERQVYTVELRPGETTFVSWKKLVKDSSNKAKNSNSSSSNLNNNDNQNGIAANNSGSSVPSDILPKYSNLNSRLASSTAQQPSEKEAEKDAPAPNRFNAVIEKIERLYMGKDSSDDEDLDGVPDEDQYDTEDSFIDDTELDEYFEVDHSSLKHDGFFVNRGKLEHTTEPAVVPNQQPKKRRKDVRNAPGDNEGVLKKQVKKGNQAAGKQAQPTGNSSSHPCKKVGTTCEHHGEQESQNHSIASGNLSKRDFGEARVCMDPSLNLNSSDGNPSASVAVAEDVEKPHTGSLQTKNIPRKLKHTSGSLDVTHQKDQDKFTYGQTKLQISKPIKNFDDNLPLVRSKEKAGSSELPDLNLPQTKVPMQATKTSKIYKKDGSIVRSKGSILEKAIRELEKMVAESRPPSAENQEVDTSSQATKRRLPREVKLKLAKVARLAQASQGKISKELLSRLMSILGHLIQLRTLKRNLKVMVSMGLSAKKEKDDKFQQIKTEVVEMIKTRLPATESKAMELNYGSSDDFQDIGSNEKGTIKMKFSMDDPLEEKICDLYDLFVDGLDEDAGPQVRKLYVELAKLWPSGLMDNHGIKRAICRAKERRRAMHNRNTDHEKIKRKKISGNSAEERVRVEPGSVSQPQYSRDRSATESGGPVSSLVSRPIPGSTTAPRVLSPSMNLSNLERLKPEKPKGSASDVNNEMKKKTKRKPENEIDGTLTRQNKSEERQKSLKQASNLPQKLNLQSSITGLEQSG